MRTILTKRRVAIISVLVAAAIIFATTKLVLEETAPGTWEFLCEIKGLPHPDEVIQVGDTMYLAAEDETIRVFKSYDGCNWTEIESPASDHDIWSTSIALFRIPDHRLGIVWEETDPDPDKKPRSTFFWSTYDGSIWSEPEILFHRDEYCFLEDALMLEDGALLLLWEEPLVQYLKSGDRTIEHTGCHGIYRAYFNDEELLIDRVIEPEDPRFCNSEGYYFADDGHHIWCAFRYGRYGEPTTFYRSWSEDGRMWSPPEPFPFPYLGINYMLSTSQGEIELFSYYFKRGSLFLRKSTDWENWSSEKIFRTERDVIGGFRMADVKNGTMWGLIVAEDGMLFIQPSEESAEDCQGTMLIAKILGYLTLLCFVLTVVFALSWIQKRSRKIVRSAEE